MSFKTDFEPLCMRPVIGKGYVNIPVSIREALNLKAGDNVLYLYDPSTKTAGFQKFEGIPKDCTPDPSWEECVECKKESKKISCRDGDYYCPIWVQKYAEASEMAAEIKHPVKSAKDLAQPQKAKNSGKIKVKKLPYRGFHEDANGKEIAIINGETIQGDWITGYYAEESGIDETEILTLDGDFDGASILTEIPVIPETVGQNTDFVDRNGKEVFDGDVCKDSDGNIVQIIRMPRIYAWGGKVVSSKNLPFNAELPLYYWGQENNSNCDLTKVGNIFQNPNLTEAFHKVKNSN